MLLNTGDFEIGIDLGIGFHQIAFLTQEVDSAAEIPQMVGYRLRLELFSGCRHVYVS
jgi:hypothetical protein